MNNSRKGSFLKHIIASFMTGMVLLIGCQPATLVPTATTTATATLTPLPTSTTTATPAPFLTLQNVDDEYPEGAYRFDPVFANIRSGTYVIYWDNNGFNYLLVDGSRRGSINKDIYLPYYDRVSAGGGAVTSDFNDPEYMGAFATSRSAVIAGNKVYPLTEMTIISVKLRSGEQHVWKGVFPAESGVICTDIALSPNDTWIAVDCQRDEEYYVALMNIRQGTTRLLRPASPPCMPGANQLGIDSWSPDEKWLSVTCYAGSTYAESLKQSCLVSVGTGEFYCPREEEVFAPEAWSPDGSKVAIDENKGALLRTEAEAEACQKDPQTCPENRRRYLLITDTACLRDAQACPEYLRVQVPYELGEVVFDQSGNTVVWESSYITLGPTPPSTIYVADLTRKDYYSFSTRSCRVIGISPDGKLIVIKTDEGTMLLTLTGEFVSMLPDPVYSGFVGWLVVP